MQYELQRRQKEEFNSQDGMGAFLKKNQTIAPYFREFLMNKRRKQKCEAL